MILATTSRSKGLMLLLANNLGKMLIMKLVLLLSLLVPIIVHSQTITGRVIHVADGDTLTVLSADLVQHKVRLSEIDAPEIGHGKAKPGQAYGENARQALSKICGQESAIIKVQDQDRYQRLVGQVNCNGIDANLTLVRDGMAWAYPQYVRRPEIVRAARDANNAKRGLWADPNPIPPWDWRHRF